MEIKYTIIRSSRKTLALQIKNGEIIVRAPMHISNAQIGKFVEGHLSWIAKQLKKQEAAKAASEQQGKLTVDDLNELKKLAREVIPGRVRYYAEKIGVTYGRVTIRAQHTRWGSCSSKGNLNFNCLLMLMPPEALDSVVVHELCHLKEMNHSRMFYDEVLKVFPEYYKWNGWIKKNGRRFIDMLP